MISFHPDFWAISRRFLVRIRRFAQAEGGSVALIFALVAMVLVIAVGIAVDYGRAGQHRERLQAALDSAVQMAAVMQGSTGDRQVAFKSAFDSQFGATPSVLSATPYLDLSVPGEVRGTAQARVRTSVMGVVGYSEMTIGVTSVGILSKGAEFMMVLDVSGSMKWPDMSGMTRIDVLKQAATGLVDTAIAAAPPAASLKFGYVPFTMNVNIGTANAGYVDNTTHPLFTGTQWAGCVLERPVPNHLSNTYSAASKWHAYIYPPETTSTDCDNAGDGTNSGYAAIDPYVAGAPNPYTRGPNYNCVRHPMAPLTSNAAAIKAQIAGLTAEYNMGTILAPGVTWGTRLLTPNAPFPGADPMNSGVKKVLVMLTDGGQTTEMRYDACSKTQNPSTPYNFTPAAFNLSGKAVGPMGPRDFFSPYGYIYDSDPFGNNYTDYWQVDSSLDPLAIAACNFAKSQGIEIYSIAVSSYAGPGTSVYNTLRACANDDAHMFLATDASALTNAFADIGRKTAQFVRTK